MHNNTSYKANTKKKNQVICVCKGSYNRNIGKHKERTRQSIVGSEKLTLNMGFKEKNLESGLTVVSPAGTQAHTDDGKHNKGNSHLNTHKNK